MTTTNLYNQILSELNCLVQNRQTFGNGQQFQKSFLRVIKLGKMIDKTPNIPHTIAYHRLLRSSDEFLYMAPEEFDILYKIIQLYVHNLTNNTKKHMTIVINNKPLTFIP